MKKNIALLSLLLLTTSFSFGQQKNSIVILGKPGAGGVWLRWAPRTVAAWQLGMKHGYTLERFTLKDDGDIEPSSKHTLAPAVIKPYTAEQFKKLQNPTDGVSAIEELLYHQNFTGAYSSSDIGAVLSKSKELENRFGMVLLMADFSMAAAEAAGLFVNDTQAEKGKRYAYRVRVAAPAATATVEPGAVVVTVTEGKPLPPVNGLTATFSSHKVTLTWPTLLDKGVYTAYYIEKSADGKTFQKLSDLPYVHMGNKLQAEEAHFVDSLAVNNKTFYYRLNGITPFAEVGPYSNTVSGQGKDNLGGLLIIREGKVTQRTRVRLVWEFPVQAEQQIAGFIVACSNNPNTVYTDVIKKPLPRSTREFFHETLFYNTYYIVRAVDSKGVEVTRSFPFLVQVPDETPPANPTGLAGTMAANGVAALTWNANTDIDFMGYRVFRSNSMHEEFVEVTREFLPRPYYRDTVTLHALNKKIYYYVVAVDKNYNPSDYSNLLVLKRPDIIAPAPPVFTHVEMKKDTIALRWEGSVSDDIQTYELVRVEKEDRLDRVIKTWGGADALTRYADYGLTPGKTYAYKIIAVDSAGNKAVATSRNVFFETGLRAAVSSIKVVTDRDKKTIALAWKNERPGETCTIFRKVNEGTFIRYETVDGNIETFVDANIPINNVYTYKIQVGFKAGIRTELSGEVVVKF